MIDFPSSFSEMTEPLLPELLDAAGAAALRQLNERGYEVQSGLTPKLADQILTMSYEPSIREYCPKDSAQRFVDRAATIHWLSKKRAVFLLFERVDTELKLVGYGWAGVQTSAQVPGGESTFALRLGEAGQGQGLATPFAQTIMSASASIYGASNMWLETWASNGGAVHIYHKLGFITVVEKPDERPRSSGGIVPDTRLYMSLPKT